MTATLTELLPYLPGVDLVTERTILVMQDRPVVGLSAWLLDAAVAAEGTDRELQLVTPASTRITYPVRSQLLGVEHARWIVDDPDSDGAFDGLTGQPLFWACDRFEPAEADELSPAWISGKSEFTANLQVSVRVRYEALETAVIGHATETVFAGLSGGAPAGWGTEEPVSQPWNTGAVTAFCRRAAPRPTMLTLVGSGPKPAVGTLEVHNRPAGLEESVTLAVAETGLTAPEPEALVGVAERLAAESELVTMVVMATGAAPDTCTLPMFTGLAGPVALALGPEARRSLGPAAEEAIEAGAARSIGPATTPGLWFAIGTGESTRDWQTFRDVIRRLADGVTTTMTKETPA